MAIEQKSFGKSPDGQEILLYTISNRNGIKASVTNYGAILVKLLVPDKKGNTADVVLGYDEAEGYFAVNGFLGATVGPNANRIADARFSIDGTEYHLDANDGRNNLHSHKELGYHNRVWQADCGDNSVIFSLTDQDGSMGFPGNKEFQVTYTLDDDNALTIDYHADSDKKTILNPTNHSYFNLDGHDSGSIEDHEMWMNASCYTPVVAGAIPTGEIADVAGTPMDFTKAKRIGLEIEADFEQLKLTDGYDHNWVLDDYDGSLKLAAVVEAPVSGRRMQVFTTLPGVQFYAGNGLTSEKGKGGAIYEKRQGLCLETQFFPNSANEPAFPSCIFGEGKEYTSVTVYKFI